MLQAVGSSGHLADPEDPGDLEVVQMGFAPAPARGGSEGGGGSSRSLYRTTQLTLPAEGDMDRPDTAYGAAEGGGAHYSRTQVGAPAAPGLARHRSQTSRADPGWPPPDSAPEPYKTQAGARPLRLSASRAHPG